MEAGRSRYRRRIAAAMAGVMALLFLTPIAAQAAVAPTWLPGQEAWLDVPSVNLHKRVFPGGQATLDLGQVTHYRSAGVPPPVAAGRPGVYWLAGHHSTHGAPLASATSIVVGDLVRIRRRDGVLVRYRITGLMRTGTTIPVAQFYGPVPGAARLLIQTCLSDTRRLLVVGTLVA
jgi:sortase (surface protein transpeptidase)